MGGDGARNEAEMGWGGTGDFFFFLKFMSNKNYLWLEI